MNERLLGHPIVMGVAAAVLVLLLLWSFLGSDEVRGRTPAVADGVAFDAFAGGYPVPPMPGQVLPQQATVVAATTDTATTIEED